MADCRRLRGARAVSTGFSELPTEDSLLTDVVIAETQNSVLPSEGTDDTIESDRRALLSETRGPFGGGSSPSPPSPWRAAAGAVAALCRGDEGGCEKRRPVCHAAVASLVGVLFIVAGVSMAWFANATFSLSSDPSSPGGRASAPFATSSQHAHAPEELTARTDMASVSLPTQLLRCNETAWPGKRAVCGECKVHVSGSWMQVRRLGSSSDTNTNDEGNLASCVDYCHSIGRDCDGAWQTASRAAGVRDACSPAWQLAIYCHEPVPEGMAICQCGHPLKHRRSEEEEEEEEQEGEEAEEEKKEEGGASVQEASAADDRRKREERHQAEAGRGRRRKRIPAEAKEKKRRPPGGAAAGGGGGGEGEEGGVEEGEDGRSTGHSRSGHGHGRGGGHRAAAGGEARGEEEEEEEQGCNPFEEGKDYWTKALLEHLGGTLSAEECNARCAKNPLCGAWSWGKARGVEGVTDVCFLKSVDEQGSVTKHYNPNIVSGMRSDRMLCLAKKEMDPSHPRGVIKNRHGQCLAALNRQKNGGKVQMWTCIPGDPNQLWAYDKHTGQIKNQHGFCLDAEDRALEFSPLTMYECDTNNWNQQWDYFPDTGLIKNWKGICVDGAESNVDGGEVYMRACRKDNYNQAWSIGPLADLLPAKGHSGKKGGKKGGKGGRSVSMYCFALMLPHSYEQGLLAMQFQHKVSLFQCEAYAVYSNMSITVADGLKSGIINSTLHCNKGGEFGTALNNPIFLAVWKKVAADGIYLHHDWTVKVDPDAVFFPQRLREMLSSHEEIPEGVYLNNCKFGLHGPLEVFSRNAVKAWEKGRDRCQSYFNDLCNGDCMWGEDMFIDQCLWKVLYVRRQNDFRLLVEDHCDPPQGWEDCRDATHAAFHPYKDQNSYMECMAAANSEKKPLLRK